MSIRILDSGIHWRPCLQNLRSRSVRHIHVIIAYWMIISRVLDLKIFMIFIISFSKHHIKTIIELQKPQLKNDFCKRLTDCKMSIFNSISFLLLIAIVKSSRFSDWGSDDWRIPGFIKSGYQSQFIFEINVGKRLIRHKTTLNLNDVNLDRLKIDWRCGHSNSESFYVRSDSFRHWFQK